MEFNSERKAHLDKEAFVIVGLIEIITSTANESIINTGSVSSRPAIDWSAKMVDPVIEEEINVTTVVSSKRYSNCKCYSLTGENYKQFEKLIDSTFKEKNISEKVSRKFLRSQALQWLFDCSEKSQCQQAYSDYMMDKINESICNYESHFCIHYLDIENGFKVGGVQILYYTKPDIDAMVRKYVEETGNSGDTYEIMYKNVGKVYAVYTTEGEHDRAMEIALAKCSQAVDVLRICSDTLIAPEIPLSFDIDSRINFSSQSVILTMQIVNNQKLPITTIIRPPRHYEITARQLRVMQSHNLSLYSNFLKSLTGELTEMQELIINGINQLSRALGNRNLHERISQIFSVLESLLLKDDDVPIISTVSTYCSKLISKNPQERAKIISLLKVQYGIRSKYVHHAVKSKLDISQLSMLQQTASLLLVALSKKGWTTKKQMIKEVETAILAAY
jgi:hypothetical protein